MSRGRLAVLAVGLALVAAVAASGWTVVRPGEVVVVRRLGRVLQRPWGPGPHWGLPPGLDHRMRVRLDEVRDLTLGHSGAPDPAAAPGSGEYLAGDGHLIQVRGTIQYRVQVPSAYVLNHPDVDAVLRRVGESALTRALAHRPIDEVLGAGRSALAEEIETEVRSEARKLALGISILGVSLTDARPPSEVQPDFDAAQSARSWRDQRATEGRTYAAVAEPKARAEAEVRRSRAQAEAETVVRLARARAERFLSLAAEFGGPARPDAVRRLYLDTLAQVMRQVRRKVLMTPEEPVDLIIFPEEAGRAERPKTRSTEP